MTMPYHVDCLGLSDEFIEYPRFGQEFLMRREWCREHCGTAFDIQPIREAGKLVGRRFLFADLGEATLFKLTFETNLMS